MEFMHIVYISLLTFVSSCIGNVSGFGLSTIMVPIISMVIALPETLLFVGIIHWFSDMWRLLLYRRGVDRKLVLEFGIPGIVTSFLGASLILVTPGTVALRLLGLFLISYCVAIFLKPEITLPQTRATAVTGGIFTGFFSGIFGMGGALRSAFLSVYNLSTAKYLATGAAIGIIIDTARLVEYALAHVRLEGIFWWGLLIFIPISFLGAWVAKYLVNYIPHHYYRRVVALFLLAVGVKLLVHP